MHQVQDKKSYCRWQSQVRRTDGDQRNQKEKRRKGRRPLQMISKAIYIPHSYIKLRLLT